MTFATKQQYWEAIGVGTQVLLNFRNLGTKPPKKTAVLVTVTAADKFPLRKDTNTYWVMTTKGPDGDAGSLFRQDVPVGEFPDQGTPWKGRDGRTAWLVA